MKSKYLSSVVLVLALVGIVFISGCIEQGLTTQSTTNFLTHESPAYGVRIDYPADWTKQEIDNVAIFLSPKESASDIFQEKVSVIVKDLSTQPMTLSEYTESYLDKLEQLIVDLNIVDSGPVTLAGNLAHKVVYTTRPAQYDLKFMKIWTVKNNKAYLITYIAEVDKYSDFLGTIETMIDSFEIK